MEAILVTAIVAVAAGYLVRRFYLGFKASGHDACACSSGCRGCDLAGTCSGTDLDPPN